MRSHHSPPLTVGTSGRGRGAPAAGRSQRLRDLPDVDEYVLGTVQRAVPAAADDRRALLQAQGVLAVQRVERALPPEVPLVPVLDTVLPARLAALAERLSRTDESVAAVA